MFNVDHIISVGGIFIVSAIIFAESGLLVGFFLPGDTLLFGAGLAASQGRFSILALVVAVSIAAVIGDNVGYSIGHSLGKRVFTKKDGILFRHEYIKQAEDFYNKHGGKTIILARFTPIVRTFAPVVAGAGNMPRKRFMMFNLVGGILWGGGMSILGYTIGSRIPHLDKYIDLVIVGVMVASLALAFGHILKDKKSRRLLVDKLKSLVSKLNLNKKDK